MIGVIPVFFPQHYMELLMGFVVGLFLWFSSLDLKVGFVEGGKGGIGGK